MAALDDLPDNDGWKNFAFGVIILLLLLVGAAIGGQ